MDAKKILDAIDIVDGELNTATDGLVKNKQVEGLRSLVSASKGLGTVRGHVERAVRQTTPKEAKS